jgi:hypothetical protein
VSSQPLTAAAPTGAWQSMPQEFAAAVAVAPDQEAVLAAVASLPAGKQRRLLHPSGGVAAILTARRPGDRVLVLGSPHLTLPTAFRTFGAEVWCADWSEARLRCGALLTGDAATWVRVAPDGTLPFRDGAFDHLVVDLDDLELAVLSRSGGDDALRAALREAVRVLASDGSVTAATSNQILRRAADLPARASSIRSRWRGDLLRSAGLPNHRVFVPLPDRRRWKQLSPLEELDPALVRRTPAKSPGKRRLAALAGRTGLTRWALPDFYVIADRRPAGSAPVPTFLDTLDGSGAPPHRIISLTDARVGVISGGRFRKVPLSPFQSGALADEVAKADLASRTAAFGPCVVPGRTMRVPSGAVVADYPLLTPREDHPAAVTSIAQILAGVPVDRSGGALAGTGFWVRLASEHGAAESEASGAGPLRRHVLEHLGTARAPVGPTHGDLHAGNLIHTAHGTVLIDWNRFEVHNPLVFDRLWSSVVHRRAQRGTSLLDELLAFVNGVASGALHDLAVEALGELTRDQAAVLLLLDRVITHGEERRRTRPWTLPGLRRAAIGLQQRMDP